jgi:hypothetical protein
LIEECAGNVAVGVLSLAAAESVDPARGDDRCEQAELSLKLAGARSPIIKWWVVP